MAMNKKLKTAVCVVGVLAVATGGFTVYQQTGIKNVSADIIEIPVATEPAIMDDIIETVSASGTVNPAEENGVYIATTQKVANVYVELGDVVTVGDVLCDYDVDYSKKELENSLQQQQINLKNANLNLQNLTVGLSETEELQYESNITNAEKTLLDAKNSLESAKTKITQLENDLKSAEKTVDDNKVLLDIGAITKETYDQSVEAVDDVLISLEEAKLNLSSYELAIQNAESSLEQAQKNYDYAKEPLSSEASKINYQQQQNEIAKAQLTIQNVQDQISDLTYSSVSHVAGTIIEVNVEEGSIVNDETSIVKIADLNKLVVNANVSEYDAPLLEIGQSVTITTDAIENSIYTGEVTYISPIATVTNTFSGSETTVAIKVAIDNPDGILKPGYSVDMEISVTDARDVLSVSLGAVMLDPRGNNNYVLTVNNQGLIEKKTVETGATDDIRVEILSGLSEGDMVVTSPTADMVEGTPISDYATSGSVEDIQMPAGEPGGGMGFGVGGAPSGGGGAPSGGMGGGAPSGGGGPMGR